MADSVAKRRSGAAKEDEVAVPSAERMNLNVENSIEVKKKGQEVTSPEQESSPWITTRSLCQQAPFAETVFRAEQPDTSGTHNKLNGQKEVEDKSDKTENRTETLRMKLCKILGIVSSPNKRSNSQRHEVNTNNLNLGQSSDQKGGTLVTPRQNSDTIEADSEGFDYTIWRPVTRSLTRKRAPPKVKARVTKRGPPSSYMQSLPEKKAKGDQQDIANPSSTNVVDQQGTFQNPTFGFKTPISSSTPTSTPKTDQLVHDAPTSTPKRDQLVHGVLNPARAERIFTVGEIRSFRTLRTSKPDHYGSNTQTGFSVDAEELKFSPPEEAAVDIEEKDTENSLSESSAEERDCESLKEGSPINEAYSGCRERDALSPEPDVAEKPNFMLHSTKRLRTCEGIRFDNISSTLHSPKETGESNWIQEPSEQSQEDAMLRAIKMFLQKVQSKIKSATTKKSSEILMSIADGMYLQLQKLEAHIQTDVGKLTSLSELKRKRLEAKFEEQQKQLKLINEKFKEDINQYLQDCTSTLEGMEADHIELKGTVEKQRALHRKSLLQAEVAVETQLNDAKRRITAIHELGRRKMLQLKLVISWYLKEEGILS